MSDWIRKERRLGIYIRDNFKCVWCNHKIVNPMEITLDHLTPRSKKGTNNNSNLATSCRTCNSKRGNKPIGDFATVISSGDISVKNSILKRIKNNRNRKVYPVKCDLISNSCAVIMASIAFKKLSKESKNNVII